MDARTELQECIKNMTEEAVLKLFEAAEKMMLAEEGGIDSCPYCGNKAIIGYGKRCSKQRYYFKHCLKTFVTTTHTIMSESHQSAAIGNEVITDTVQGHSIDFTKERLNLSHAYVFDMQVGKINCVNGNIV